jgi:hypothetical protein
MVMISNLIHIQKPVRRVEADLLGFHIDLGANRPVERDKDLFPRALHKQQFPSADGKDVPDPTDPSAIAAADPAADELEKIEFVLSPLPQGSFGKMNVQPRQTVGLRERINALQLKVIVFPPPNQRLDFIFPERPFSPDENTLQLDAIRRRYIMESEPEIPSLPLASYDPGNVNQLWFFDNLEVESPLQFHPCGTQNNPNGPGRPSLFSDDFPEIFRSDLELQDAGLFSFELGNLYLFRVVNECFGDQFNEFFHRDLLKAKVCLIGKFFPLGSSFK